jgi:hypothetical protein
MTAMSTDRPAITQLDAETVRRLGGEPIRKRHFAALVSWVTSMGLHAGLAVVVIAFAATAAHFAAKPTPPPALVMDFQQPVYAPTASLVSQMGPPSSAANPAAAALPSAPSAAVSEQLRAAAGDALVAIRKAEPPISLAAHQMGKLGGDSRPIQVDFVGLRASNARRIVYVVDASGSLVGSFPQIVEELRRSMMKLDPRQQFGVIFFQRGDAVTVPPGGALQPATPERLSEAVQWIDTKMIPAGRSNPLAALEAAMVLKPEIIFLLSADITGAGDYEISEKTLMEALDRMNPRDPATHNRPVRIQCVQFLDPDPSGTLERLAREHGGADGYRYLGRKELGLDNNQE